MEIYTSELKYILSAIALNMLIFFFFRQIHKHSYQDGVGNVDLELSALVGSTNSKIAPSSERANATFVILVRNSDLHMLRPTIRQLEDRFNRKYNYPYVFLNDVPFDQEFIELTSALTNSRTEYGVIPQEHWSYPSFIDQNKAKDCREKMKAEGVIYGGSESYRHMCRFQSGYFFQHPLLAKYKFYWRVEPGVQFFCDLDFDPFLFMQQQDKKYGFVISLMEYNSTIPTLWSTVTEFIHQHPKYVVKNNALSWISHNEGKDYNLCHFWSNFEIASMDFLRSPAYEEYFRFLDQAGGFYYERWGDAPVHSIAAALFLNVSDIHFFNEIGYKHEPFSHCPTERTYQKQCHCDPATNFDNDDYSCTKKWKELFPFTYEALS